MPREPAPLWRKAFDVVERAVASPLERGTNSSEFAVTLAVARRLQRGVARRADAVASWAWHQVALPSAADVRRLQRQVAAVERELGALRRDLDTERRERRETP
jgi:hypothetical protein